MPPKRREDPKELREFKFLIQPVLLQYEGDKVPVEVPVEPVAVQGLEGLKAFVEAFPADLASLNVQINAGS